MKAIRELFRAETGRQACLSALANLASEKKTSGSKVGLIILKPIQLQDIYANLGYGAGSNVVSTIESAVKKVLAAGDLVLRLDDGKFAVILASVMHPGHALLAANKLRAACEQSVNFGGNELALRLRIGIAVLKDSKEEPEAALQRAELALREADETDQPLIVHGDKAPNPALREWEIEKALGSAIANGELNLFFQPKIDVRSSAIVGVEGLVRWEKRGLSPEIFVPVAERTGQIADITRFALQSAVRHLAEWPKTLDNIGVSVNLSATDLQRRDLPAAIKGVLEVWGVNPSRLTLEVTETALIEDPAAAHDILKTIREMGCRVSIDDFGTGYSSLGYFKKIPADELKIDKSFVRSMLSDAGDRNVVRHVISLAHSFGLQVVAEGVENQDTLDCLSEMECDYVQGFFFSAALSGANFLRWVRSSGLQPVVKESEYISRPTR